MPVSTLYFGRQPSLSAAELPSKVVVTGLGKKIIRLWMAVIQCLLTVFWKIYTMRSEKI